MNDQILRVRCVSVVARSAIPAVCMYMSGGVCAQRRQVGGCVVIRLGAGTFKAETLGEEVEMRVSA
jgi:hypothetical protein